MLFVILISSKGSFLELDFSNRHYSLATVNVYLNCAVKLLVQKAPQDPTKITFSNLKMPLAF